MTLHETPHIIDGMCECDCSDCMFWVWDGAVKYAMCRCVFCDEEKCGMHEEGEE